MGLFVVLWLVPALCQLLGNLEPAPRVMEVQASPDVEPEFVEAKAMIENKAAESLEAEMDEESMVSSRAFVGKCKHKGCTQCVHSNNGAWRKCYYNDGAAKCKVDPYLGSLGPGWHRDSTRCTDGPKAPASAVEIAYSKARLWHGTDAKYVADILKNGLLTANQQYPLASLNRQKGPNPIYLGRVQTASMWAMTDKSVKQGTLQKFYAAQYDAVWNNLARVFLPATTGSNTFDYYWELKIQASEHPNDFHIGEHLLVGDPEMGGGNMMSFAYFADIPPELITFQSLSDIPNAQRHAILKVIASHDTDLKNLDQDAMWDEIVGFADDKKKDQLVYENLVNAPQGQMDADSY